MEYVLAEALKYDRKRIALWALNNTQVDWKSVPSLSNFKDVGEAIEYIKHRVIPVKGGIFS